MTAKQSIHINHLLGEGYGTEDIAVMLDIPLKTVTYQVAYLRAHGTLKRMATAYQREMGGA